MTDLWPPDQDQKWPDAASLVAATTAYEMAWWRWDPAVLAESSSRTSLRGRLLDLATQDGIVTTADVYRDTATDVWSSARDVTHARAVASCQIGAPSTRDRPCAHVTIGCPGSGKTTALRRLTQAHRLIEFGDARGVVIVDADRVRRVLPEYADGEGHRVVAEECFDVTYELVLPQARAARHDLVFDTLGRPEAQRIVEGMVAEGYDVHLLLAEAPVEVCLERAQRRALVDGRSVTPALVESVRPVARATFDSLVTHNPPLAGWALVDTAASSGELALLQSGGRWTDIGSEVLQAARHLSV